MRDAWLGSPVSNIYLAHNSINLHRCLRELQSRTMPAAVRIQAHLRGRLLRQRIQRLTCALLGCPFAYRVVSLS